MQVDKGIASAARGLAVRVGDDQGQAVALLVRQLPRRLRRGLSLTFGLPTAQAHGGAVAEDCSQPPAFAASVGTIGALTRAPCAITRAAFSSAGAACPQTVHTNSSRVRRFVGAQCPHTEQV